LENRIRASRKLWIRFSSKHFQQCFRAVRSADIFLGVIEFIARKLASMKCQVPERFPVPANRRRNRKNQEAQSKSPPEAIREVVILLVSFAWRQRVKPGAFGFVSANPGEHGIRHAEVHHGMDTNFESARRDEN